MKFCTRETIMGLLLITTIGCSQGIKFNGQPAEASKSSNPQPLTTTTPPVAPSCPQGTNDVAKPTKFILMVDQSGSNLDGPYEHPGVATDPDKALRYGALSEFLAMYGDKTHVAWSLMVFQGVAARAITYGVDPGQPVFTNSAGMFQALQTFKAFPDSGNTPYLAALKMVEDLIAADLAAGTPVDTQYRIAFLTDGYPTDSVTTGTLDSNIDDSVAAILASSSANIQLSTVYYGLPDALAASRLARMASEGNGQFLDVTKTGSLHLNDVIEVPKPVCN